MSTFAAKGLVLDALRSFIVPSQRRPDAKGEMMWVTFSRKSAALLLATALLAASAAWAEGPTSVFAPGEKLTFQLKWGPIPAGEAVLEVLPIENRGDVPVYHFVMRVKTNAFLDAFYYYRNRIDAFADLQMSRSYGFRQKATTSRKTKDVSVQFNWQENQSVFERIETRKWPTPKTRRKYRRTALMPQSFDPLSAFYYTRLLALDPEALIECPVCDGKSCVRANARIIGREKISLNGKVYDTFLLRPDLKEVDPLFEKDPDAEILVWVTADSYRIPVKLKSKVAVGSFTGELIAIEGVAGLAGPKVGSQPAIESRPKTGRLDEDS